MKKAYCTYKKRQTIRSLAERPSKTIIDIRSRSSMFLLLTIILGCSNSVSAQTSSPTSSSPVVPPPTSAPNVSEPTLPPFFVTVSPTQTSTVPPPTSAPNVNVPTLPPFFVTASPTQTQTPTTAPSETLSISPTIVPSGNPSATPSRLPTDTPSLQPTETPTSAPSDGPTSTASMHPSVAPTNAPSESPTMLPSEIPTETRDLVPAKANAPLVLRVTTDILSGDTEDQFLQVTESFLSAQLPEVNDVAVSIADQRQLGGNNNRRKRILQNNNDSGGSDGVNPLFVDLDVSGFLIYEDPSFDFEAEVVDVFENQSEQYINLLQSTGNSYFQTIEVVEVSPAPAPTQVPTQAPTSSTSIEDESSFPIGGIIGIVVGVVVVVGIVGWFATKRLKKHAGASNRQPPSTPLALEDEKNSQTLDIPPALPQKESDLESHAMYSYAQGDQSVMQNSIAGIDNMSYAYSLEPGIDTGTVDGSYTARTVPKEVPQIERSSQQKEPGSQVSEALDSPSLAPSLATADLKLTESELAMLPSDLGDTTIESNSKEDIPTRRVIAPPGKLGIVIDTTVEGPVVHYVNETSALLGKIWAGDVIIAIGDVDTRAMSASAITDLMVKTANEQRVLTVLGESKE